MTRYPTVFTIAIDNLPLETRFHARVFDPGRSREIEILAPAYRPSLRPALRPASATSAPRVPRRRR